MFDFWQEEDVNFIPTTACEEVESLIKKTEPGNCCRSVGIRKIGNHTTHCSQI